MSTSAGSVTHSVDVGEAQGSTPRRGSCGRGRGCGRARARGRSACRWCPTRPRAGRASCPRPGRRREAPERTGAVRGGSRGGPARHPPRRTRWPGLRVTAVTTRSLTPLYGRHPHRGPTRPFRSAWARLPVGSPAKGWEQLLLRLLGGRGQVVPRVSAGAPVRLRRVSATAKPPRIGHRLTIACGGSGSGRPRLALEAGTGVVCSRLRRAS